MKNNQKDKKIILIKLLNAGLKPFVILSFWISRWIHHNHFVLWLNNEKIGKPSLIAMPFVAGYMLITVSKKKWNELFANYALPRYKEFTKIHYSKDGWGYFSLENFTPEEKKDYYNNKTTDRLSYYLNHNPSLLRCKDSDSFLDVGCGGGGIIRKLSIRFPNSKINGFDVNPDAINIIKACEKNPNVKVETANLLDENYLLTYQDNSFDWVIYSHAFSFIAEDTIENTIEKRRVILKQLHRIAKKGLVMLESESYPEFRVTIEQNNRCKIESDYTEFFSTLPGEFYMMSSLKSEWAYCILKESLDKI